MMKIIALYPSRNAAGTRLAYFVAEAPSGLRFPGCKLMCGPAGKRWIAVPSSRRRDPDTDEVVVDDSGKAIWDDHIGFSDKLIKEAFTRQTLRAVREQYPELFDGEPKQ